MSSSAQELAAIKRDVRRYAVVLLAFVALMWVLELVDLFGFGGGLDQYGIHPRSLDGLPGILLHPLLHDGFVHLLTNSVAFVFFGWLVMLREENHFWVVTALATLVGGVGVWLVGRDAVRVGGAEIPMVHLGASGLIFGYFGYLLFTGWFERRFWSLLLSILVLLVWGRMLFEVLPFQRTVSWEAHLFGLAGGLLAAWVLGRRRPSRKQQ